MSDEKYHKISLNFFSEIRERTIYLFFNFATLVTFQEHCAHRNLILLMFVLSSVEPLTFKQASGGNQRLPIF